MKCARCSAEIPAQSQFCLRCGTPLQPPAHPTSVLPNVAAFPAPRQNNKPLIATIALLVLAVLGLGGVMLKGYLAQQPGKTSGGQLVQKPGEGGAGSLVQAPGNSRMGAPVQAPADANPNKPVQQPAAVVNTADLSDYLAFLGRIEHQRKLQMSAGTSKLQALLGKTLVYSNQDAAEESPDRIMRTIRETGSELAEGWNDLARQFNGYNKPIPAACMDLHRAYQLMLGSQQQVFVAFKSDLGQSQPQSDSVSSSLGALNRLKDVSSPEIDHSRDLANQLLYDVCRKYNMQKPFDISDPSGGLSMPTGPTIR